MTVELERPFVWPERPESYAEWNKEEVEMASKDQDEYGKTLGRTGDTVINDDRRKAMKEQAKALLEGKAKWKPATKRSLGSMITR